MNARLIVLVALLGLSGLAARTASAQLAGALVINEFVASNDSTAGGYQEPDGGYGDWIELYNRSTRTLDLTNVNLSDDLTDLAKWTFPAGTQLAPGAYLIVWADNDLDQTGIHASFKLSKDGEDVVLSLNGNIIDQHTFGVQETNISESRLPNGTGAFAKTRPTPAASNSSNGVRELAAVQVQVAPNPAAEQVLVSWPAPGFTSYSVVDAAGREVLRGIIDRNALHMQLQLIDLPAGRYQILLDQGEGVGTFVK